MRRRGHWRRVLEASVFEQLGFSEEERAEVLGALGKAGDAAQGTAYWLGQIARNTGDKDTVLKAAEVLKNYKNSCWEVIQRIGMASRDEGIDGLNRIMDILGDDAVAGAVREYEGHGSGSVVHWLGYAAQETMDPDYVAQMAGILTMKDVRRAVRKYEGYLANQMAFWLGNKAYETKDAGAVIGMAGIVGEDMIARSLGSFDNGGAIAKWAGRVAYETMDPDRVKRLIDLLDTEEVRKAMTKHKQCGWQVADALGRLAYECEDEAILRGMATAFSSKEVLKTVRGRKEGPWMMEWFGGVASKTKDREKVIGAAKMLRRLPSLAYDELTKDSLAKIMKEGLDEMITDRESLYAAKVWLRAKSLPKPTKDNIRDYGRLASAYARERFSLDGDYGLNQLDLLLSSRRRKKIVRLANEARESGLKVYNLETSADYTLAIDDEKKKHIIAGINGSRDSETEKRALGFLEPLVGKETLDAARGKWHEHLAKERPVLKKLVESYRKGEMDDALRVLAEAGSPRINDILAIAEPAMASAGRSTILAAESKDPLDYDSRVQMACVYMPRESRGGIMYYCKDDNVLLVRYDIAGKPVGSAICYLEDDVLLVDSVEGHRTMRRGKVFDVVYKDLLRRAGEMGVSKVIFNLRVANETAKKFISHIRGKGLRKGHVSLRLETESHLEAVKTKKGVLGYVAEL